MIPTRFYRPVAFLLFAITVLVTHFIDAIIAGQVAFPPQYAWLVTSGILIGFGLVTILKEEVGTLDPAVNALLSDAAARGTVAGISAAGGLPSGMLTPRPDLAAAGMPEIAAQAAPAPEAATTSVVLGTAPPATPAALEPTGEPAAPAGPPRPPRPRRRQATTSAPR